MTGGDAGLMPNPDPLIRAGNDVLVRPAHRPALGPQTLEVGEAPGPSSPTPIASFSTGVSSSRTRSRKESFPSLPSA